MARGVTTGAATDSHGGPHTQAATILPALLILMGIAVRLAPMLANRSLWLDEAMLALNIVTRPVADLLRPLDYAQGAPLGFLLLEKLAVTLFGSSEPALRLVPLLAAVCALPLFHLLARRCLPRRDALIALGLFALSPALAYYAGEAKQYSVDVLFAVALPVAVLSEEETAGTTRVVLLALLGAAAIWFSHPAVFVLASCGAYRIGRCWLAGRTRDALRFIAVSAVWLISFAGDVWLSLRDLAANPFLLGYWDAGFPPLPVSLVALAWYPRACQNLLTLGIVAPFAGQASDIVTTACVWIALVLASVWCARNPWRALLLLGPIGVAFIAATLGKYPFAGRLLLFSVPSTLLLLAAGAGNAWRSTERAGAGVGVVLTVALIASSILALLPSLAQPYKEEIKPVLHWMSTRIEPGDVVYVHSRAAHAFAFYTSATNHFSISSATIVQGRARRSDDTTWATGEVEQLSGHERVWIVLTEQWSWSPHEHEALRAALTARGTRLDAYEAPGASVSLWNLR